VSKHLPEPPESEVLSRTQILVAMAVTAILLMLVARVWMALGAIALIPVRLNLQSILQGVGLGLGISLASFLVYRVWGTYRRNADFYLNMVLKPLEWSDIIWLGLLPGMSEELLFRGVMLPAFGYDAIAIVLSSLCFGVMHLSNWQQWAYVAWATMVGSMLGVSALLTDNLAVPIVAHVLTNLTSSLFWKWGEQRRLKRSESRR
jgi:membrane protease YdiL (CAAX protease family)